MHFTLWFVFVNLINLLASDCACVFVFVCSVSLHAICNMQATQNDNDTVSLLSCKLVPNSGTWGTINVLTIWLDNVNACALHLCNTYRWHASLVLLVVVVMTNNGSTSSSIRIVVMMILILLPLLVFVGECPVVTVYFTTACLVSCWLIGYLLQLTDWLIDQTGKVLVAATWLILPVVIRLSQRLSHACLSLNILL